MKKQVGLSARLALDIDENGNESLLSLYNERIKDFNSEREKYYGSESCTKGTEYQISFQYSVESSILSEEKGLSLGYEPVT